MSCTRPDLSFVVSKLSQYCSNPNQSHWVAAKHVLRYIKAAIDYVLSFKSCDELKLEGYSDADWASSKDDRKSISGFCFRLSETSALISWKSRKQASVALSTCEAEYMALALAMQESLYLQQLLISLNVIKTDKPINMYEDNQSTIASANNPVNHQRSKHVDIKYHFIRDLLNKNVVKLVYCPTDSMIADIMTKPIVKCKLENFKNDLFG